MKMKLSVLLLLLGATPLRVFAASVNPTTASSGDETDNQPLLPSTISALRSAPLTTIRNSPAKAAVSAPVIRVGVWVAPSPESPYWVAARDNAIIGIRENRSVGSGPTAYVPLATDAIGTPGMVSLTTMASWLGQLNPPPPYEQGRGNRVHFFPYVSSPVAFTLADVTRFEIKSSDTNSARPFGSLAFSGDFTTNSYSVSRVGIWWGQDGVQGTADDVIRTGGPGTGLINELIYVGVANAYKATTAQELDQIVQYIAQSQPFSMTGTYNLRIGGVQYQGTRTLNFFPQTQSISLRIERSTSGGSQMWKLTLTGPPGSYTFQQSTTSLPGTWSSFYSFTQGGEPQPAFLQMDGTTQKFFRAIKN